MSHQVSSRLDDTVILDGFIFADDLTGASDTAVAFAERGPCADAWILESLPGPFGSLLSLQTHVLALNAASRHLSAEEAASRFADAVKWACLANALSRFIEHGSTLVLSGGETAAQICRALGTTSLTPDSKLLAGVARGRFCGGPAEGTQVITEWGVFGGLETLVTLESMAVWDTKNAGAA